MSSPTLAGSRVALLGKLAGMSRRDAHQAIRAAGGTPLDRPAADATLLVVGEQDLPWDDWGGLLDGELLDAATRQAAEQGTLEVIRETELWQRLGMVEGEQNVHRLYTPSMLAQLLNVPVAMIRRWHRRGLIVPAREVRRLPYFDFQEVSTARRLAELLAAGVSPDAIEKKLAAVARWLPGARRPLAQLSMIVEGKKLLLRQAGGLLEPTGQLRMDFEPDQEEPAAPAEPVAVGAAALFEMAEELEEQGELAAAADMLRAALAAEGPTADGCFLLAELLYRIGNLAAARERYHMTLELDESFVEARANLGCLLAEQGELELAAAALDGALAQHGDYADAHYHRALVLDDLGRRPEAELHWRRFLELAPESPWAETCRQRLEITGRS